MSDFDLLVRGSEQDIGISDGKFVALGKNLSGSATSEIDARHLTIFPGVTLRTCAAEKMMLSYVEIAPHAVVAEHSHPHEQVGMVLEGRAVFTIGGEARTLGPGDLYRIPGGVKHHVAALEAHVRALDIFTPVREDYR